MRNRRQTVAMLAILALAAALVASFGSTLLFVSHDRQLAATFDREVNLPAINRVVPEGSAS